MGILALVLQYQFHNQQGLELPISGEQEMFQVHLAHCYQLGEQIYGLLRSHSMNYLLMIDRRSVC